MGTKNKIWLLVAIVFAVCLTTYTLSYIVLEPWHIVPGMGGDGIKNIFTYLYHCIYEKGVMFQGMNYPYGEHIVYTDGQPLLSVTLASMHVTANTALAVLWWLIGLSYVLCIVYNYRILTHFRVAPSVAIAFAGLISVLSPQIFRIGGHYALSYLCVVPMLFYWTIKYNELQLKTYCVYIFILGIASAFIHPYFSAVVLIWVSSYILGYFIFIRESVAAKIKHSLPIVLSMLMVFAIMALLMAVTDPVKDRPKVPHGILSYTTNFNDIFTSISSPIWQYADEHHMLRDIFPHVSTGGEGFTYVGVIVTIVLILSLFTAIVYKVRKLPNGSVVGRHKFSPIWLFMAFGVLIFCMGIPFIWNMEWLLDYVSLLRQFRTLGRFAWIFYYIITVYGVVALYSFYTWTVIKKKAFIGYIVLALSIFIWSYDASGNVQFARNVAKNAPGNYDDFFLTKGQNWESFLAEHHLSKKDFQGILILDFFHVGSEKLWVGEVGAHLTIGITASLQLHLPIVDVMMSRTSLSQTEKQVKIAGGPFAEKPMLTDIKSDKPLLLIKYGHKPLSTDQQYLLSAADSIGSFLDCGIYAFYPQRQLANDRKQLDSVNKIVPYLRAGSDTCIGCNGDYYVNHLDNGHADEHLFGMGAVPHIAGDDSIIATIPIKPQTDNGEYEFSAWFLLSDKDFASPCVYLESVDSAGNTLETPGMNVKWSTDNHGLWFRGSLYFRLKAACRTIRCKLVNEPNPNYKIMDEIQLRPSDALIISKAADGNVMANNHLIKKVQ